MKVAFVAFFLCLSIQVEAQSKILLSFLESLSTSFFPGNVICYWQGIIGANEIDPAICTHIIYSFVGVDDKGNLNYMQLSESEATSKMNALINLRVKNANLKFLAAVGGGANDGVTANFSRLAADANARTKFASNAVAFIKKHKLSGLDIDWEFPETENDKKNFVLLLQSLKKAFTPSRYLLTCAVSAYKWQAEISYDIPKISAAVDFISLMAYDFYGPWSEKIDHHARMYSTKYDSDYLKECNCASSVAYWLAQKAAPGKLILGIPTYGNTFVLKTSNANHIGDLYDIPATKGNDATMGYNTFCAIKDESWKIVYNTTYRVYYAYDKDTWFGYDTIEQVVAKAKFIKSNRLGGAMFWSIDTDDSQNDCKQGKFALIASTNRELKRFF